MKSNRGTHILGHPIHRQKRNVGPAVLAALTMHWAKVKVYIWRKPKETPYF